MHGVTDLVQLVCYCLYRAQISFSLTTSKTAIVSRKASYDRDAPISSYTSSCKASVIVVRFNQELQCVNMILNKPGMCRKTLVNLPNDCNHGCNVSTNFANSPNIKYYENSLSVQLLNPRVRRVWWTDNEVNGRIFATFRCEYTNNARPRI
jgi:hypothetical protein